VLVCSDNFPLNHSMPFASRFDEGSSSRSNSVFEHNASASRLFNYLKTMWTFQKYSKSGRSSQTARQICAAVSGRPGIIYFEDCFTRSNGSVGTGDHIDYWDGASVMNDLLNYNGPGEREPGEDLRSRRWFRKAARNIWFLRL